MLNKILNLALLLAAGLFAGVGVAPAQTASRPAADPASPEEVARGFYAFYLGELNRDNWTPLSKRREALNYLTPEFHRAVPRLAEKWLADPVICAQDWDKAWEKSFTVGRPTVRGSKATAVVRLPPFGGSPDSPALKIKVTLVRRAEGWRISNTECVM